MAKLDLLSFQTNQHSANASFAMPNWALNCNLAPWHPARRPSTVSEKTKYHPTVECATHVVASVSVPVTPTAPYLRVRTLGGV